MEIQQRNQAAYSRAQLSERRMWPSFGSTGAALSYALEDLNTSNQSTRIYCPLTTTLLKTSHPEKCLLMEHRSQEKVPEETMLCSIPP